MTRNVNKVEILGQLGVDPELRYTPSGVAVCNLRVATNAVYKGNTQTEWHRVVVWRKQAENCAEYLKKGRQVLVSGSLRTRKWQDKDGQDRYTTEINANDVIFIGNGNGQTKTQDEAPANTEPQPSEDSDEVFGK